MTKDEIINALEHHHWGYNAKPLLEHIAEVLAGLPVVKVWESDDGDICHVTMSRPMTQAECFRFFQGAHPEDIFPRPVEDDTVTFELYWD